MPQSQALQTAIRKFAFRLVVLATLLLVVARSYEVPLVKPMLPALGWLIEQVDSRFRVDDTRIERQPSGRVIQFKVTPIRPLMFGAAVLTTDPSLVMTPTALVGFVLQPIVMLLAIIVAWPVPSLKALAIRVLWSVPAAMVLLVSNVPLGIAGTLVDAREIFPDAPVDPLVYWNDFLQTGGALVLAVGLSVIVLAADGSSLWPLGRKG